MTLVASISPCCFMHMLIFEYAYLKRDGFKVNVMLKKHQKKLCASVYSGKFHPHQCYRLAYFGPLIIAQDLAVTFANEKI